MLWQEGGTSWENRKLKEELAEVRAQPPPPSYSSPYGLPYCTLYHAAVGWTSRRASARGFPRDRPPRAPLRRAPRGAGAPAPRDGVG